MDFILNNRHLMFFISSLSGLAATLYIIYGPSQSKKKRKKGLRCPGLVNVGNSCFLNAVLQAVATCPTLASWLKAVLIRSGDNGHSRQLIHALHSVLEVLNDSEESEDYCPSEVTDALQAKRWVISPDQQDAHELFHVLTETVGEESTKYPALLSLMQVMQLMDTDCEYQSPDSAVNRVRTCLPILPRRDADNPFRGLIASQLQCTRCFHKNPVRHDTFDSLTLSLPQSISLRGLNIEDLLTQYVQPETLHDIDCEGCARRNHAVGAVGKGKTAKSTFVKKLTIGKLPQCLCIHIQRTVWRNDGVPMKRHDHVRFTETLNMEPYVYHKQQRQQVPAKMPWMPRLLGGRSYENGNNLNKTGSQTDMNDSALSVSRKKLLASPKVEVPYSRALNLLKALHYNVIYNPKRGIFIDLNSTTAANQNASMSTLENTGTSQNTAAVTSLKTNGSNNDSSLLSNDREKSPTNLLYVKSSDIAPHISTTATSTEIQKLANAFSLEQKYKKHNDVRDSYRLMSVVQHMGDVFSGHFVTYRRAPAIGASFSQRWLYTSDVHVRKVNAEEVFGAEAYMLFYERIN